MAAESEILAMIATSGHLMTGIGTVILVILIIKTLKHMETTTKFTEIQTNYKFRPWIGPSNTIKEIEGNEKHSFFEISLKNFGDLPAQSVIAISLVNESQIARDQLTADKPIDKDIHVFDLGPMLPNMEKRYRLDISNDLIKKSLESKKIIQAGMYFKYENVGKKNGYGMISEFNPATRKFSHTSMWVDIPNT